MADFPFVGKITLSGTLTTRTGLHIGARSGSVNPRGIDAPIVYEPFRQASDGGQDSRLFPYIPGSSLRGKLRMFLVRVLDKPVQEIIRAGGKPIRLHSCQNEDCQVCRLFGSVPVGEDNWSLPSAVHISDLRLTPEARQNFVRELKSENATDRLTMSANPRVIERIPPGTTFDFSLTYYVRAPKTMEEDVNNLLTTLALLQDDTLGGHGSRGYGQMSLSLKEMKARRFGGKQEGEKACSLEDTKKSLAEVKSLFQDSQNLQSATPTPPTAQSSIIRRVYRLCFTSPLHVGEPGVGLEGCAESVASDTLFSALANAWLTLYGKTSLEDLLAEFCQASQETAQPPPFRISSAFPYFDKQFFFPKPLVKPGKFDEDTSEAKGLKDAPFLSADVFQNWIGGALKDKDLAWALEEDLSKTEVLPRLRLDRLDMASNLYFCGQVSFPKEGGLYFLAEGTPQSLDQLSEVLHFLGSLGLGGERALGFGRFTAEVEDVTANHPLAFLWPNDKKVRDAFLTLSLYYPSQGEMSALEGSLAGYQLVERGGWVDSPSLRSPLRKKSCRLFTEGSVFQTQEPQGCLINVTPPDAPHQVYRYGFAFPVAITIEPD